MLTRHSDAEWVGSVKEGHGTVKLGSGSYEGPYSFRSRFESGTGTNPNEFGISSDGRPPPPPG